MDNGPGDTLTPEAQAFLEARNATHRQYEALRAYFVEGYPRRRRAALRLTAGKFPGTVP